MLIDSRKLCCAVMVSILAVQGCMASYSEPRYSDAQLLSGLSARQNQTISIWAGEGKREIGAITSTGKDGCDPKAPPITYAESCGGGVGGGLQFPSQRPSPLLEAASDRAEIAPEVFLPALSSSDPEMVVTAMWLIKDGWTPSDDTNEKRRQRDAVASALRQHCLNHPDVRIRWYALNILADKDLYDGSDVVAGMADTDQTVREYTALFLLSRWCTAVVDGTDWKNDRTLQASLDSKQLLMSCLIEHLADDDWIVREMIAARIGSVAKAGAQSQSPLKTMPKPPMAMAYIIAGRPTCLDTQAAWKKWWSANEQQILGAAAQASLQN